MRPVRCELFSNHITNETSHVPVALLYFLPNTPQRTPHHSYQTHRESPRVVEEPLPPRERWDDFDPALLEQVKRIGHGAYGEVYRCRYDQWTVAAKYIKARPGVTPEAVVREFNKEAELLSMVDHANIVYMYGAWCHLPDLCLVTELCPHGSLFDILQRQMKRLHPELMARIALDVARAMAAIHAAKIIHRDLKYVRRTPLPLPNSSVVARLNL